MPDDSSALRVPKQAVPVEMALAGEPPRTVEVFVAEHRAHAFRRQDVLDLLEHEHSFLPARDVADGAWVIFNKETVMWLAVAFAAMAPGDVDDEAEELFDYRKVVRVVLQGGSSLQGEVLYSLPSDRARVVDVLNVEGRFFRLWTPDRVFLVNKAFVLRVVET